MSVGTARGRFAAACRCGTKALPNQDSFFYLELAGGGFVVGVMDGHGTNGHVSAC